MPNARNAQAQQQQAAAAAAALGADRLELQAGARWLEDSLPFVVLLLLVFLQQHIFGIGAFCWLSTVLHNANARIRTQVLLKEQRDSLAVLSLASLLFSQMCMVVMLCGASKLRAQLALRPEHDGRQASSIFELLWAVLVSDLMVRYGTMLLKVVLTLVCPAAAFRRLRRVFSLLESAGLCYRSLLPMPLWYEWLLRSVQGRLFASLLTGLYLTFKLAALVERLRATLAMGRSLLLHQPPFGKYATTEAVLEAGDEVCAICQEHMSSPVLLDSCSHLFCEECILAWCERRPDPTCPLCRAPLATSMGAHSDGTTSLLPQVF